MKIVKYTVSVDESLKHMLSSFTNWITRTLNNQTHGITKLTGVKYRHMKKLTTKTDITITLVPQSKINRKCGYENLSCTIRYDNPATPDEIMISFENWMGASDFEGSLPDYRTYIINHEFLHARPFYFDHPKSKEISERCTKAKKLPVMYQQSRGKVGKCKHNPWPLKSEF